MKKRARHLLDSVTVCFHIHTVVVQIMGTAAKNHIGVTSKERYKTFALVFD